MEKKKAYKVFDDASCENFSTIVFADNRNEAKALALRTDVCEDARYIDVRAQRLPEADCLYKGSFEIDWYDEDTRLALVRDFGWSCFEPSFECAECPAKQYCSWNEEEPENG